VPEVEPNDDGATAQTVTDGTGVDGSLEANGADDYYAIDLLAGQTLTVDLGGCAFDSLAFVYADPLPDPLPNTGTCFADTDAVACNDDGAGDLCSLTVFTAANDATYYIRIASYGGNSHGDYPMIIDVE